MNGGFEASLPPEPMDPVHPETKPDERPIDIEAARQMWWAATVLWLIGAVASMVLMLDKREILLDPTITAMDPELERPSDLMVVVSMVPAFALIVGLAAVFMWVVRRMHAGANWARILLTALGTLMVLNAVPALLSLTDVLSATGLAGVIGTVSGILQALAAGAAIVMMFRPDSNAHFARA